MMKKLIWLVVGTAVVAVAGCELVVDFDRSKIPQEGTDAGTLSDVTQPPLSDAAPDVATTDAAKDGATLDAAPDGAVDGGSDANVTDANPDAAD